MNYKVEKHIAIKDLTRAGGRPPKYPFHTMQPGDSFLVPSAEAERVGSAASQHGRRFGQVFTTRKVSSKQARCWRVL